MIWPKAFRSYWRFAERYCLIEETPWARKVVGDLKTKSAAVENDDLLILIRPGEVLDLPEYLFETIDVDLRPRQRKAYDEMSTQFMAELADGTQVLSANEIGKLIKLQQIASWWDGESAKHDALIEMLDTTEGPHLVWTHWKQSAEALVERLNVTHLRAVHVGGDTPTSLKDGLIERFKAGSTEILVLSLGVGKFGHTLTNARTIHWVDKTFNADDYFQALHRVRRIGLTHRPLSITYRAPGTTDELVEANLEGKLGSISKLTRVLLASLLRGLKCRTR